MMAWVDGLFYVLAGATILCALMVVLSKNPIRSALFLVMAFFTSAAIWLMTGAEFLSLILVLVYVGAVMTLFLFVIMMLEVDRVMFKPKLWRYMGLGIISVTLLIGLLNRVVNFANVAPSSQWWLWQHDNTRKIGEILYTLYGYPFILAGVLLLIAIISAVSLVHRPRYDQVKRQNPSDQIGVRKEDRVVLMNMDNK